MTFLLEKQYGRQDSYTIDQIKKVIDFVKESQKEKDSLSAVNKLYLPVYKETTSTSKQMEENHKIKSLYKIH